MDKEDIETAINKIVSKCSEFRDNPTYELAMDLDKDITILRYIIGESNFLSLHYFRAMHEKVVKLIDEHDKHVDAK